MNDNPPPRPRFSSRRPPPRRATARRGRPGGLRIGEWVRAGGTSGVVRLRMGGTTGARVGKYRYNLDWMCSSLDGETFPDEGFDRTTNHVAYTVFREPLSPWTNEWTNVQNAWTNALEFISGRDSFNYSSLETNTLASLTHVLFMDCGLKYDTTFGASSYTGGLGVWFNLSGYMATNATCDVFKRKRPGNVVNCYDQAGSLVCFSRLFGIDTEYLFQEPFGFLNPSSLVGIPGSCNNPFFAARSTLPLEDVDNKHRSNFGNHAFVRFSGHVFDSCGGPETGERTLDVFLLDVIDRYTPDEEAEAANTNSVPDVYTFQFLD